MTYWSNNSTPLACGRVHAPRLKWHWNKCNHELLCIFPALISRQTQHEKNGRAEIKIIDIPAKVTVISSSRAAFRQVCDIAPQSTAQSSNKECSTLDSSRAGKTSTCEQARKKQIRNEVNENSCWTGTKLLRLVSCRFAVAIANFYFMRSPRRLLCIWRWFELLLASHSSFISRVCRLLSCFSSSEWINGTMRSSCCC